MKCSSQGRAAPRQEALIKTVQRRSASLAALPPGRDMDGHRKGTYPFCFA